MLKTRLLITSLLTVAGTTIVFAQQGQKVVPDRVMVKYKANSDAGVDVATSVLGGKVLDRLSEIRWQTIKLPASVSVDRALSYYKGVGSVESVVAVPYRKLHYTPNDPMYNQQYGPQTVNCPTAWDFNLGSPLVKIAIIDTGCDYNHPDLAGKIIKGPNETNGGNDPMDVYGHGSHCAGIAAANTNNGIGVAGAGFNCSVLAIKVFDDNASTQADWIVKGELAAVTAGVDVMSMSYGGYGSFQPEADALALAVTRGILPVAAAGNDNTNQMSYPGAYPNVLSVGASDRNDAKAGFSNYGTWVRVAAPGVQIMSTLPGNKYEAWDGTSMACPLVAGCAGLLKSYSPSSTGAEIKAALEDSAKPLPGNWVVKGRIDVKAAMLRLIIPVDVIANGQNPALVQGSSAVGGSGSVANNDGVTYDIRSMAVAGLGGVAAGSADLSITRPASKYLSGNLIISASAQATSTLSVYLWNYNSGGGAWELLKSVNVGSGSTTATISLPSLTNYLKNNTTKVLVRSVLPERISRASYALKVDRVALSAKFDPR